MSTINGDSLLSVTTDHGASWSPLATTVAGRRLHTCDLSGDNFQTCLHDGFDSFSISSLAWNQRDGAERILLAIGWLQHVPPAPPPCTPPPDPPCFVFEDGTLGCLPWTPVIDKCRDRPPWPGPELLANGIFKSTDGRNWQLTLPLPLNQSGMALVQSPDGVAFAAVVDADYQPDAAPVYHIEVLESVNGGESWQAAPVPPAVSVASTEWPAVSLLWMGNALAPP